MKPKSKTQTVPDYEALDFYVNKLGFERVADKRLGPSIG